MGNAIKKYGSENFHAEEIEECDNSLLNEREKYWINFYNSYSDGYNMTKGGEGGNTMDTETRRRVMGTPIL